MISIPDIPLSPGDDEVVLEWGQTRSTRPSFASPKFLAKKKKDEREWIIPEKKLFDLCSRLRRGPSQRTSTPCRQGSFFAELLPPILDRRFRNGCLSLFPCPVFFFFSPPWHGRYAIVPFSVVCVQRPAVVHYFLFQLVVSLLLEPHLA
jgi:hypothetical protein